MWAADEGIETVLIFGAGKLAGSVLDMLATRLTAHRYVLVSRSRERSLNRVNLTRYMAAQWGHYPEIRAEETNLMDVSRTAELVHRYQPTVVFNATTPFAWWKLEALPTHERNISNSAGPGMWCALDCILPLKLTQALEKSGLQTFFVNACYPDMTNTFLSASSNAPIVGIGNISNLIPGLQLGFAAEWGEDASRVEVQLVGHHYLSWNAPTDGGCGHAPYDLTVKSPTRRVRYSGPGDEPFSILRRHASRVRGLSGLGVTIGSAATVLSSVIARQEARLHCPGALGLPGGYPVVIDSMRNVHLDLPPELSPADASRINHDSQILDGVECVSPGLVEATLQAKDAFQTLFAEELPVISAENVSEVAQFTVDRLRKSYAIEIAEL